MRPWKVWLGVGIIFVAGLLIGIGGTCLFIRARTLAVIEGGPVAARELVLRRLSRRLALDRTQVQHIEPLIKEAQEEILRIRKGVQPEIQRALAQGVSRIKTELRPDQQEELERIYQRFQSRVERFDGAGAGSAR